MRGLVGIEVVSLTRRVSHPRRHMNEPRVNLHQVVLEELLQLSLGGRVREVSNVQSPALGSTGNDCLVLGGVDGLVTTGTDAGALGRGRRLADGGVGHLGGGSFDGHGNGRLTIDDTKRNKRSVSCEVGRNGVGELLDGVISSCHAMRREAGNLRRVGVDG